MAATTEVIKMQMQNSDASEQNNSEISATAYFACLQDMMQNYIQNNGQQKVNANIEALSYCYSAIISMLDFGVISNQEKKIIYVVQNILQSQNLADDNQNKINVQYPGVAQKYALVCLQFVLHTKSERQWNEELITEKILNEILSLCTNTLKDIVQKQAIKTICIILQNKKISKLHKVGRVIRNYIDQKISQILQSNQLHTNRNGQIGQIESQYQQQAIQLLNFLSGAFQLMPIQLCAELIPKVISISEIDDSKIKVNSYLTIEVLFASRRFSPFCTDNDENLVAQKTLKMLLENSEIIQNVQYENRENMEDVDSQNDMAQQNLKVDKRDEMRIISYIQAVSQVILNIATTEYSNTSFIDLDTVLKLIATTISSLSEYLIESTWKIQKAATSAIKLIISHGLAKIKFQKFDLSNINNQMTGSDKIFFNLKYLLSQRFAQQQEVLKKGNNFSTLNNSSTIESILQIIKTFVEAVHHPLVSDDSKLSELLLIVSQFNVHKEQYAVWTHCIGSFMGQMGCKKFFQILPMKLIEFDLNSQTYSYDSRSWLIPLIPSNLKKDADLLFFVKFFLPMILKLDKMRELELTSLINNQNGSQIKIKKYETLLVQIWQLLPQFCMSNSEKMSECFAQILKYLDTLLNQNVFGLRNTALRTFSSIISHCRNTKVVDQEIKATRKGLQNISMDYIQGLIILCTKDADEDKCLEDLIQSQINPNSPKPIAPFYKSDQNQQALKTLQEFASIAKKTKLSNLFLQCFASLNEMHQEVYKNLSQRSEIPEISQVKYNQILRRFDVLISLNQQVKLNKENQVVMMQGLKSFIKDSRTKKKAYKLLTSLVEKYEFERGIEELIEVHQNLTSMVDGQATKQRLRLVKAYVQQIENLIKQNKQCPLDQVANLLKHYIIELINSMSNTNIKIRVLAQEVFTSVSTLMRCKLNAVNNLFTIILIGLAGNNQSTQSSTIRSLIFTIKQNVIFNKQQQLQFKSLQQAQPEIEDSSMIVDNQDDNDDNEFADSKEKNQNNQFQNMILASDPNFQQFLLKATKIISIFLKDKNTSQELTRSVLKFIKISINLIDDEFLKSIGDLKNVQNTGIAKLLLETMFQQKISYQIKKQKFLVRKIIQKLIKRCGAQYVTKNMPENHRPIVAYIEKQKRKDQNKKDKEKLLALIGDAGQQKNQNQENEESDENASSSEEDETLKGNSADIDQDSELESSDSEVEDEQVHQVSKKNNGSDILQAPNDQDIPRVDDIPIVSKLAKQSFQEKLAQLNEEQKAEMINQRRKEQINKVVHIDEDHLETHFVENPYIKLREKASNKIRDGKVRLGQDALMAQAKLDDSAFNKNEDENMFKIDGDQDIYIIQESGKMVIKDQEKEEKVKLESKSKRQREGYGVDSDTDSDEGTRKQKKVMGSANELRKLVKQLKGKNTTEALLQRNKGSARITKNKSLAQIQQNKKQLESGHIMKYSGDVYKSQKGQGDIIKAGKLEPFSYIQLNPRLLNKRNKQKAIKSFSSVVTFGKKLGKREENKLHSSSLSGLKIKK